MDTIEKLTQYFTKLPGIGSRQAKRLVYFILTQGEDFSQDLASILNKLQEDIAQCDMCFRFYHIALHEKEVSGEQGVMCGICANPEREAHTLMVLEKDADLEAVHKTDSFKGRFFIIGGALPLLEKQPEKKIRARALCEKVQQDIRDNGLKEIILAFSANPEGDHTTMYIKKILEPFVQKHGLIVSVLGRGLSTGTELEYADFDTLHHALRHRN